MDKHEFDERVDQLKELAKTNNYDQAVDIANSIDWRRVGSASLLSTVSGVYEKIGDYSEAKNILLLAYERLISGKYLLYRLTCLALKEGKLEEAEEYYKEFYTIAADDSRVYLLRYLILKAKDAPIEQLVLALESYNNKELNEEWLYELAECYYKAGRIDDCVNACDKLILMFGVGEYVDRAVELKSRKDSGDYTLPEGSFARVSQESYQEEAQTPLNQYSSLYPGYNNGYGEVQNVGSSAIDNQPTYNNAYNDYMQNGVSNNISSNNMVNNNASGSNVSIEEKEIVKAPSIHTDELLVKQVPIDKLVEVPEEEPAKNPQADVSNYSDTGVYDVGAKELSSEAGDISIEEVDIVDTKKYAYIIESRNVEAGLDKAKDILKSMYSKEGVKKRASKVEAAKLNERGVEAVYKQINGNNLVVTELGDLNTDLLGELNKIIKSHAGDSIFIFIDNGLQLGKLRNADPELFGLCSYISLDEKEPEEEYEKETPINIPSFTLLDKEYSNDYDKKEPSLDYSSSYDEPKHFSTEEPMDFTRKEEGDSFGFGNTPSLDIAMPQEGMEDRRSERKRIKALGGEDNSADLPADYEDEMDIDSFAEYASDYAQSIDCVIMGEGMHALYERAEIMAAEGIKLTKAEAESMIEEVADYAEKPPMLKKIFKFSPRYNKDGQLILKGEHFLP